jgi:hypothetical protein
MEDSQEEALATEEETDEKYNEEVAEEGPSEADLTVRFIEDYVRDNRVSRGIASLLCGNKSYVLRW